MNINMTARQFEITDAIREYGEKRIGASLEDKALNVTSVNMVMDRVRNQFTVDIVVNCKYHVIESKVEEYDLYKAIDSAADKIDSQLTKLRGKIRDHQAQPMREAEPKPAEEE